jgi:hypothetical protein
LQFLVVISSRRDQTTSPVWFVRLVMGPPGTPEIGRSQPTTSNGPAKLTEAVVSAVRNEPTEQRFEGATLWRRTYFSTASASWRGPPVAASCASSSFCCVSTSDPPFLLRFQPTPLIVTVLASWHALPAAGGCASCANGAGRLKNNSPTRGKCGGLLGPDRGLAAPCGVSSLESGFGVPFIRSSRNGRTVALSRSRSPTCDHVPREEIDGTPCVGDGWNSLRRGVTIRQLIEIGLKEKG